VKPSITVSMFVLTVTAALLVWSPPASAQDEVTVQGEIIDMACYMACAQMCAKKGVPIGVLTDGGEVYLLLDDHNNPDPYDAAKKLAGERAEISGKKFSKQGVASIVVSGAKGL